MSYNKHSGTHPQANRTLFVRNVNYCATKKEIRDCFAKYGKIKDVCKISTKGVVFVTYSDLRDAETAMKNLQSTIIRGRPIYIDYSLPRKEDKLTDADKFLKDSLFIKLCNTDNEFTVNDARKLFTPFGDIKYIRNRSKKDQKIIEFYDTDECDIAKEKMEGKSFKGGILTINYAKNVQSKLPKRKQVVKERGNLSSAKEDNDKTRDKPVITTRGNISAEKSVFERSSNYNCSKSNKLQKQQSIPQKTERSSNLNSIKAIFEANLKKEQQPIVEKPKTNSFRVKGERCVLCDKLVYAVEKIIADNVIYHKSCFRCTHCNNVLSLGNYVPLEGKLYCKPHSKQFFSLKGNYSSGFGTKTPQQQNKEAKQTKNTNGEFVKSYKENIIETINNILVTCPLKKVDEYWENPKTGKTTILLVRAARICPNCNSLVQIGLEKRNCKNGCCNNCGKWFCLRCLTIVEWAGDHETCCTLSHPHNGYCWCYERGLQVKNSSTITYKEDFLTKNYNYTRF